METSHYPASSPLIMASANPFPTRLIMRKSLIQHLEQRGVQVIFWCLNEESDFEAAYGLGATGVITDYPTILRRYLDNRGGAARVF
ncbi:hypothetical protein GH733_018173 [Mirounga leonina]|nr:hypothetical protein GH733_018173 [Mirounga leonina]